MGDFREPLVCDVFKRRGIHDRETDKEDIGLRIGERSESVVVLLSSCVPEIEAHKLSIDVHVLRVVVEARVEGRERKRE